jgi:hypothetical protein
MAALDVERSRKAVVAEKRLSAPMAVARTYRIESP